MKASKATSLLKLSFALLIVSVLGGCSGTDTASEPSTQEFQKGTLSSSSEPTQTTSSLAENTSASAKSVLLRVEGGDSTRFSGLCSIGEREYVIGGAPSKTYSFENLPLSCKIKKQDPGGGNLRVTLISEGSTRSVQQTNAEGGIVNISWDDSR